ncbi:hypothetical protein GN316_19035 [Xylophilus sp. Kf1]|nr:hypothetical protein [Xylophilus sp. Kf1]
MSSTEAIEAQRRLGHDLFCSSRIARSADWPAAVHEGFDAAHGMGYPRATADRFVRKWLQLRLGALRRHRIVDCRVTAEYLQHIDIETCPITREKLSHGERLPTDWSIDRLNNDGGYAPSNLAVMSTRANIAKGARSFEEVLALANGPSDTDGLSPAEWGRMASLMLGPCFAEHPGSAPIIALTAPIAKFTICLSMQQVQHLFTNFAVRQSGKNQLVKELGRAASTDRTRMLLTQLAEAAHQTHKRATDPHDVWLHEPVMRKLEDWRRSMDDRAWGLVGEISRRLIGAKRVNTERVAAWSLPTRGYFQ